MNVSRSKATSSQQGLNCKALPFKARVKTQLDITKKIRKEPYLNGVQSEMCLSFFIKHK